MIAESFASNDWLDQQTALSAADAHALLQRWYSSNARLGFGYFRSEGGVMQTGHATLHRAANDLLTLDTRGSRIAVVLKGAEFCFGNIGSLTADFRAVHDLDGLSIMLGNGDWLYLVDEQEGGSGAGDYLD